MSRSKYDCNEGEKRVGSSISGKRKSGDRQYLPEPEGDFCNAACVSVRITCTRIAPARFRARTLSSLTYYNAGLRVFDIRNQFARKRSALSFRPAPEGQEGAHVQLISTSIPTADLRDRSDQRRAVRAGVHGAEDSVIIRAQKNEDLQEFCRLLQGASFFFPLERLCRNTKNIDCIGPSVISTAGKILDPSHPFGMTTHLPRIATQSRRGKIKMG